MRTLKLGMRGEDICKWQDFLIDQRFLSPRNPIHRTAFDQAVQQATLRFQQKYGLPIHGEADLKTVQYAQRVDPKRRLNPPQVELERIPDVMRAKSWLNGEALMRDWLSRAASNDPLKGVPNTTTIKMKSWALTFERAKSAYDRLVGKKKWMNSNAQTEIMNMLQANGKLTGKPEKFGDFNQPVPDINKYYVTREDVDGGLLEKIKAPLDDMFAALGGFSFRAAVQGMAIPVPTAGKSRYKIVVETVGIYIRDSYDFNDAGGEDQLLGYWNTNTNFVAKTDEHITPALHLGKEVRNSDFRQYRSRTGKGGDFLVFSDLDVVKLNPPDVFHADAPNGSNWKPGT